MGTRQHFSISSSNHWAGVHSDLTSGRTWSLELASGSSKLTLDSVMSLELSYNSTKATQRYSLREVSWLDYFSTL